MEPKQKLEEYLEGVHKDRERFREMVLPADIPPIGDLGSQCDDSPPRWKEVQEVIKHAKASSAPGPNGVPYRLYKSAPDVLRFLWKLIKIVVFPRHGVGLGEYLFQKRGTRWRLISLDQWRFL